MVVISKENNQPLRKEFLLELCCFGLAVRVSKQSNYGYVKPYATVLSSTPRKNQYLFS